MISPDKRRRATMGLLFLLPTACSGDPALRPFTPPPANAREIPVDEQLVTGSNRFGLDLFDELRTTGSGENVFLSPVCLTMALCMAVQGARGETREAMASALGLGGFTDEQLAQGARSLMTLLEHRDPKVRVRVANACWMQDGVEFLPQYRDTLRDHYFAELHTADLGAAETLTAINDWVKRQTAGRIERIVDQLADDIRMVLLDAVWFKARWEEVFDPQHTRPMPFHRSDGTEQSVPMMRLSEGFRYHENERFQAVRLAYGDGRFSMLIVLPREDVGLAGLLEDGTTDGLDAWAGQLQYRQGTVEIPRFRAESSFGLSAALKRLGMDVAFDVDRADFSGIAGDHPLYLGDVQHKVFVQVDEEGTEAAAVTGIMVGEAASAGAPFHFLADRPFLCAIREDRTGLVLFVGVVEDPAPVES